VIDVAFTRAELRPADVIVVIDVLRATSTITQALDSGYQRVFCVDSVERGEMLRRAGRVLAGLCSGTEGAVALEDTYVAGRLSAALPGERTDAAQVAEAVARAYRQPLDALEQSADAAVLRAAELTPDITYCALESTVEIVPRVLAAGAGVAVVGVDRAPRAGSVLLDREPFALR
jgi:phosphosulfolactate phosphohydrolase-like enzyme